MKALLVTTVERTKAATMGAETEFTRGIAIIPWREIAGIAIGIEEGDTHTLTDMDGKQVKINSFSYIDPVYHSREGIEAAIATARQAIKAMTPPPEPTNEEPPNSTMNQGEANW